MRKLPEKEIENSQMIWKISTSSYFKNGRPCSIFLFGEKSLEGMKKLQNVIWGVGPFMQIVKPILSEMHVPIAAYVDNNVNFWGKYIGDKKICSPYDYILHEPNVNIIVCVFGENINQIRCQLERNGYRNYSIVTEMPYYDEGDNDLNTKHIEVARKIEKAYPSRLKEYQDVSDPFGILGYSIKSIGYWRCVYKWIKSIITDSDVVLEIGPGAGMLSGLLREENANCVIDWLDHGDAMWSNSSIFESISQGGKKGEIISGLVESPKCEIQKKYSIIIMTEVMEHFVCNPLPTIKKISEALGSEGSLFISTPNWGHVNIYRTWQDMPDPFVSENVIIESIDHNEHVYQYDKTELLEIFEAADLDLIRYDVTETNNHNFWLKKRGSCHI